MNDEEGLDVLELPGWPSNVAKPKKSQIVSVARVVDGAGKVVGVRVFLKPPPSVDVPPTSEALSLSRMYDSPELLEGTVDSSPDSKRKNEQISKIINDAAGIDKARKRSQP